MTRPGRAAEAIYRYFYERRRRRFALPALELADLPCKIVSVGNITVGGTGKTPAVQWIARWLAARGARVAVVARGYGGQMSAHGALVSDGTNALLDARQAGDEPLLHARALPGVAVVIGRDREAGVMRAVEAGAQVVILDDGFQYWSVRRNFDLVLLDARRPFDNGRLLPVGRLREPPATLARADAVLLTRTGAATSAQIEATREAVGTYTAAPVFESSHEPVGLRDERNGAHLELECLRQTPIAALSAIADNESFARSLADSGARVVRQTARRDHHRWKAPELQQAASEARRHGAIAMVTTEKDAVKIDPSWLGALPLWSLKIELQLREDGQTLQNMIGNAIGISEVLG